MHVGEILDLFPDDAARARYCQDKAIQCRNEYFAGQRNVINSMLQLDTKSKRIRYRNYSEDARRKLAVIMWKTSSEARSIISDEQMYSRWAGMFSSSSFLSISNIGQIGHS